MWTSWIDRILLCTTSWSRRFQNSNLLNFPKVLAVAEAVAKDPYVESYLKLKSMGKLS